MKGRVSQFDAPLDNLFACVIRFLTQAQFFIVFEPFVAKLPNSKS